MDSFNKTDFDTRFLALCAGGAPFSQGTFAGENNQIDSAM